MSRTHRALAGVFTGGTGYDTNRLLNRTQVAHGIAIAAPQVVLLAITPWLSRLLGLGGFGLWTFSLTGISVLMTFDGGMGYGLLRFLAVYIGGSRTAESHALLTRALAVWVSISAVVIASGWLLRAPIVACLTVPADIRQEAESCVTAFSVVAATRLLFVVLAANLRALRAYCEIAFATLLGIGAFFLYAFLAPGGHRSVPRYVTALGVQWLMTDVCLVVLGWKKGMRINRRRLPVGEMRSLWRYAWTGQAAAVAALVMLEVDAVVIAVMLPLRQLGLYGIAATVATGFRSLPLFPVLPLQASLADTLGREGIGVMRQEYELIQRQWIRGLSIYAAVIGPLALGLVFLLAPESRSEACLVGGILLVGYVVELSMAMFVGYLAVEGQPGLAARISMSAVFVNVALTPIFAWALGLTGIVLATAAGEGASVAYAVWQRRKVLLGVL